MVFRWLQSSPCVMRNTGFWVGLCLLYAVIKSVLTIDCYDCKSRNGENPLCEDTFLKDTSTFHLIERNCFYGFWRAQYCIKLKGTREDGSTIMVRQCAVQNWGSHCGLIQFETAKGLEDVDGCLETCDFDGCNTSTTYKQHYLPLFLSVIFIWSVWLWNGR